MLATMILLVSGIVHAQNLSQAEQQQLLQDVKVMKERLNKLENKSPGGLKTTNYANETADGKSDASPAGGAQPSLTAEQTKKLMEDINALKTKQSEAQKMLDQLEKEE